MPQHPTAGFSMSGRTGLLTAICVSSPWLALRAITARRALHGRRRRIEVAGLDGRPDGLKDSLRLVQLAFIELCFEQLDLWVASLCQHRKLQTQLFARNHLADQIGVQQKLI